MPSTPIERVGILSTGEMGSSIGATLKANGIRPLTTLRDRSEQTRRNAEDAGIEALDSTTAVVRQSDIVLSVVPPNAAPDIAQAVAKSAREIDENVLFAELNAIAPSTAEEIEDDFGDDLDIVDGCIIGPASSLSDATFCVSGARTSGFMQLDEFGLCCKKLGDRIGQASGLKLCYAGTTKGTSVVGTDLMLSAAALDVEEPLRELYEDRMPGVLAHFDSFIPSNPKRAGRRKEEMEELAGMLESFDIDGAIPAASYERLEWLEELNLDTDNAENATEAVDRMYEKAFGENQET